MSKPRIYGYARTSGLKQELSVDNQEKIIRERASLLEAKDEGVWAGCPREQKSAVHISWEKRPVFKEIYQQLAKGDIFIVWTLSRIDRSPWGMFTCLQHLMDRGIRVIALELDFGPSSNKIELDLATPMGKFLVTIIGAVNMWWLHGMMESSAAGRQRLYDEGYIDSYSAPLGMKAIKVPIEGKTHGNLNYRYRAEWVPEDCAIIREIWIRRKLFRETFYSIGFDLAKRQVYKHDGTAWARMLYPKARPCHGNPPRANTAKVTRVYTMLEAMIEKGDVPPELQVTEEEIKWVAKRVIIKGAAADGKLTSSSASGP